MNNANCGRTLEKSGIKMKPSRCALAVIAVCFSWKQQWRCGGSHGLRGPDHRPNADDCLKSLL